MTEPRIGLALSGGGFRASAFGLGCLRALRDHGVLSEIEVVSGVSGGALLAGLYAYGPSDFEAFDVSVISLLKDGLQLEILRHSLRPDQVIGNLFDASLVAVTDRRRHDEPRLRRATRTDSLRAVLARKAFGERILPDVTHPGLEVVISATDLRTSNAVRFGSALSSCSPYGIIQDQVSVADAVAASAAYPMLLPALERRYSFQPRAGTGAVERAVLLSDGGIYDNLALTVLEPGRSRFHTAHVFDLDYVVLCDAGRGPLRLSSGHFAISRMRRSFETAYRRAQDGSRRVLYQALENGRLKGVIHVYLGMDDGRLPAPMADLVPRTSVDRYPTDFRSMSGARMEQLTTRGEQLTRALLQCYCPEL